MAAEIDGMIDISPVPSLSDAKCLALAGPSQATPTTLDFLYSFTSAELERFTDDIEVMEPQPAKESVQRGFYHHV